MYKRVVACQALLFLIFFQSTVRCVMDWCCSAICAASLCALCVRQLLCCGCRSKTWVSRRRSTLSRSSSRSATRRSRRQRRRRARARWPRRSQRSRKTMRRFVRAMPLTCRAERQAFKKCYCCVVCDICILNVMSSSTGMIRKALTEVCSFAVAFRFLQCFFCVPGGRGRMRSKGYWAGHVASQCVSL